MTAKVKTLKDVLDRLKALQKEKPEALDMPLVYGSDEEGNAFYPVYYDACFVAYDFESGHLDMDGEEEVNSICIN